MTDENNQSQKRIILYIPMGIKLRSEIFDGFSWADMRKVLIVAAVAGIIDIFVYILFHSPVICILFILVVVAAAVIAVTKDSSNVAMVDYVAFIFKFMKSQKKYKYVYTENASFKIVRYVEMKSNEKIT